ncbi:MAG: rRNA small subunit methyltransferase I [uncultured Thiotrichaceae bacterium]|uniref:Ribosomal RNA small subunit methyltransferase I n=1 Tax=uncultured Thiotrichaceae bacterium TaxID=298394 RepID=A0A6S6S9Y0_9GAMM|nr:MAG: rRNA small subunit methyltransferase I [uncultured Thiotrichaceae bacterium]
MEAALYCVATPIGNLGDITERAVSVLRSVDVIYAEDTRVTRKLLTHLGIQKSLHSLHQHNEAARVEAIFSAITAGQSIALVSDAGTPLISDPGYYLVGALVSQGINVIPVPGVSALITALSAAGLPTDRFAFEGFLSAKGSTRRKAMEALKSATSTLVFYESSHRIKDFLIDLQEIFGAQREIVIARELTKLYEHFYRGSVSDLLTQLEGDENMRKGEFVVMVAGVGKTGEESEQTALDTARLLEILVDELPVKQAATIAAKLTGQAKNSLYRQAMEIKEKEDG